MRIMRKAGLSRYKQLFIGEELECVELSVRPAELADARILREIYSQYIETPITF